MEEERNGDNSKKKKGDGESIGQWQAIMAMVTSQGGQTVREQSSRKAGRKLPETDVTAVVFPFSLFFFSFRLIVVCFRVLQGHEPPR